MFPFFKMINTKYEKAFMKNIKKREKKNEVLAVGFESMTQYFEAKRVNHQTNRDQTKKKYSTILESNITVIFKSMPSLFITSLQSTLIEEKRKIF